MFLLVRVNHTQGGRIAHGRTLDAATLRGALVAAKILARTPDGRAYWLTTHT